MTVADKFRGTSERKQQGKPGSTASKAVQECKRQEPSHLSDGFSRWLRAQRALTEDRYGFYLSLIFHAVMLAKFWPALPATHLLYYFIYVTATLACMAWQHSGRASYAAYRDWIQAAIRLDVFLAPPRVLLWEFSVAEDPPSLPDAPSLASLATLGLVVSKAMTFQLLLLPFAHSLTLWPHLLVQLVCVSRVVAFPNIEGCATQFFGNPATQAVFDALHGWLQQLLGLFLLSPLTGGLGSMPRPTRLCSHVVRWTQVMVGLVLSVAAQALWDARSFREYSRQRRQQRQLQREAHAGAGQEGGGEGAEWDFPSVPKRGWYDMACDALHRRLLLTVAGLVWSPAVWLLMAAAAWDAVRVALW